MKEDPYSRAVMQARFTELGEAIARIENSSPRLERDALYETLTPGQLTDYRKRILKHEEGLFDLKQQYASLARALRTIKA